MTLRNFFYFFAILIGIVLKSRHIYAANVGDLPKHTEAEISDVVTKSVYQALRDARTLKLPELNLYESLINKIESNALPSQRALKVLQKDFRVYQIAAGSNGNGGESGGGGDWLESQFYPIFDSIPQLLLELGQGQVRAQGFTQLIKEIEVLISEKPLYLGGDEVPQINLFPFEKKIILYRIDWEKKFLNGDSIRQQLFEILDAYFSGNTFNDLNLKARDLNFPQPALISNLSLGEYEVELGADKTSCLVNVELDKLMGQVSLKSVCNDTRLNQSYICKNNQMNHCLGQKINDHEFQLRALSRQHLWVGSTLKLQDEDEGLLLTSKSAIELKTEHYGLGYSQVNALNREEDMVDICRRAAIQAQEQALSRCQKTVNLTCVPAGILGDPPNHNLKTCAAKAIARPQKAR